MMTLALARTLVQGKSSYPSLRCVDASQAALKVLQLGKVSLALQVRLYVYVTED